MQLPKIPNEYIVLVLVIGLIVLRGFGIDSWTTAAISTIIGYITGKHLEQTRYKIVKRKV